MHKVSILVFALSTAACAGPFDAPEVAKCEKHILNNLDRPDTYKRGQYDSLSLKEFWEVGIEYSYLRKDGARVDRAWQICDFPIDDGKPDISKFLKLDGSEKPKG